MTISVTSAQPTSAELRMRLDREHGIGPAADDMPAALCQEGEGVGCQAEEMNASSHTGKYRVSNLNAGAVPRCLCLTGQTVVQCPVHGAIGVVVVTEWRPSGPSCPRCGLAGGRDITHICEPRFR